MAKKRILYLSLMVLLVMAIMPSMAATINNAEAEPTQVTVGGQVNISINSNADAFLLQDIPSGWSVATTSQNFVNYDQGDRIATWTGGNGWIEFNIPQNAQTDITHTLNASVRGDYTLLDVTITETDDSTNETDTTNNTTDNQDDTQDQQDTEDQQQNQTDDTQQNETQQDGEGQQQDMDTNTTEQNNTVDQENETKNQQMNGTNNESTQQNNTQNQQDSQPPQQPGFGIIAGLLGVIISSLIITKKKK